MKQESTNTISFCLKDAVEITKITPDGLSFCLKDAVEIMKITPDGFYVRNEKVPQNADEARAVYNAFISWLVDTGYYTIQK